MVLMVEAPSLLIREAIRGAMEVVEGVCLMEGAADPMGVVTEEVGLMMVDTEVGVATLGVIMKVVAIL